MKKFLATLGVMFGALLVGVVAIPQQGIFPASGGGTGGFPITIGTTAIGANATITKLNGLLGLNNLALLSASSDIGAQCTAAVTAFGSVGGTIVLPNSASISMATGCTGIPQTVSVKGYGKLASKIACTVAGDCFQVNQNPTTGGEIGGKFSGFEIDGSAAANQVLVHCIGCSGWTWDDVQFEPYGVHSVTNGAVCLEFENNAAGIFTEGNTVLPNVAFERACTIGVYFHDDSPDTSYAYNHFWLHVVAEGANYGVVADGGARLYGGSMVVFGNHVGPGGGIVEFNDTSGSGGTTAASEFFSVQAEESGTVGSVGAVITANSSGFMNFAGTLMNGPGGAAPLLTLIAGAHAANFNISDAFQSQGGSVPLTLYGVSGNIGGVGGWGLDIVGKSSQTYAGFVIDNSAQTGGKIWSNFASTNQYVFFEHTTGTQPLALITTPTTFANLAKVGSLTQFCWGSTAQYATTTAICDTGMSRIAANSIALGNGTQGDFTATLKLGTLNAVTAIQANGTPGVTKTCTVLPTVANGIITSC